MKPRECCLWLRLLTTLLLILTLAEYTRAHVRLLYPAARSPTLDFLDNARTRPPCGVPKPPTDQGVRTPLLAGSTIDVTWFMSYEHAGGFRIEILDPEDNPVVALTPEAVTFIGDRNTTAQTYRVTLPEQLECSDCALRLIRQATEWGPNYQFWSCADVTIERADTHHCSGRGHVQPDGTCLCERMRSGAVCQYDDECSTDDDCGGVANGQCQQLTATPVPSKQCFCKAGWYGRACDQPSSLRPENQFDQRGYQMRDLGNGGDKLFWKILQETKEIEMALQFSGRSWVAVGWRPLNIDPKCADLAQLTGAASHAEPTAEGEPEGTGEPEGEPEGEATGEPTGEPVGVSEPTSEPTGEPSAEPGAEPTAEPSAEPQPEPEASSDLPQLPPTAETAKPAVDTTEADFDLTTEAPLPETTSNRIFTDIVLTAHVPILPNPTTDSPAAATDEPLTEAPATDAATLPGGIATVDLLPVTQPTAAAVNTQPATTEPPVDEHGGGYPGAAQASAVIGDVCYGDWRWPAGCRDCDYRVSWTYIDDTDEIEFSVETRAPSNWWTGIGFSKAPTMAGADMVIVKSQGGRMTLHDMYSEGYGVPREDLQQDVYTPTVVGTHVNGVLRATFTRKRDTGDLTEDHQFSDAPSHCYHLLFPVSGGRLGGDGSVSKHLATPHVSTSKICIRSCLTLAEQEQSQEDSESEQEQTSCDSEYRFPTGCEGASCAYVARWQYSAATNDVRFEISGSEIGRWAGIGLSRDGGMTNSDIYAGWVYDGQAYVTDRFAYGRQLPSIDPAGRQNIYDLGGSVVDDIQTIWFRRDVVTEDALTDYPLDACYYFLFPISGGRVLARTAADFQDIQTPIGYHDLYQPRVSRHKICICNSDGTPIGKAGGPARVKRQVTDPFAANSDVPGAGLPPVDAEPEAESHDHSVETEPEPSSHSHSHSHSSEEDAESEPRANKLHEMDCTDIVVASAIGQLGRIDDYYSISRATPQLDAFYGGEQSLTAAAAYEQDGTTTVVFRRKLVALDAADHDIFGPMEVIWAKGQESEDFYELDVFKYHGRNRGHLVVDFFEEASSVTVSEPEPEPTAESIGVPKGQYGYPANCVGAQCSYSLEWFCDSNAIHFSLSAKMTTNAWTGVGFSADGQMAGADVIVATVDADSTVAVTDRFARGYGAPTLDTSQDVFDIKTWYSADDGRLTAEFSRGISPHDTTNDTDLAHCQYFLFAHSGGPLNGGGIGKHTATPDVARVCPADCPRVSAGGGGVSEPEPKPTPGNVDGAAEVGVAGVLPSIDERASKFQVKFKITNEPWTDDLQDRTSDTYLSLANRVQQAVDDILSTQVDGYGATRVKGFSRGSVNAELEVAADELTARQLYDPIRLAFELSQPERLVVDPQTVVVEPLETHPTPEEIRNYIIIATAVCLVIIAILVAICMILRSRKSKSKDFKSNPHYLPFAPYSYMLNGYTGTYPGAYQYPPNGMPEKKGFDNQGYHQAEARGGLHPSDGHNRQFSTATTATPNGNGASPGGSSGSDGSDPRRAAADAPPVGVGETTYSEWFQKVAASSQSHQEAGSRSPPQQHPMAARGRPGGPPQQQRGPYVSYPNDPNNYYTLNGQHRAFPPPNARPPMPYYRPY